MHLTPKLGWTLESSFTCLNHSSTEVLLALLTIYWLVVFHQPPMAAYTGFWTMIGDPHSAVTGIGIVMTIIVWSLVGDQMSNSQSRYCPQLMIGNLGVGLSHQHKAIHSRSLIILSHTHLIPFKSFHPSISHNDPPMNQPPLDCIPIFGG
jgi:hypothetical protein